MLRSDSQKSIPFQSTAQWGLGTQWALHQTTHSRKCSKKKIHILRKSIVQIKLIILAYGYGYMVIFVLNFEASKKIQPKCYSEIS